MAKKALRFPVSQIARALKALHSDFSRAYKVTDEDDTATPPDLEVRLQILPTGDWDVHFGAPADTSGDV